VEVSKDALRLLNEVDSLTKYETRSRVSEKSLSRRQYIKYAAAGVAAVALAGAACYGAGRLGILNRAPMADFEHAILSSECQPDFEPRTTERTLRYIRANSEEEITFSSNCLSDHYSHVWYVDDRIAAEASDCSVKLSPGEHKIRHVMQEKGGLLKLLNKSSDPDTILPPVLKEFLGVSGELQYSWIVDSRNASSDRDYSTWLPAAEHKVRLNVSDRMKEAYTERTLTIPKGQQAFVDKTLTVDPADLPEYPEKKLRMPIKGMNYVTGLRCWGMSPVPDDEMLESFYVIKSELGCNAIRLVGDYEERLLRAVEIAKGLFSNIVVTPYNRDLDRDETITAFGRLAEGLEAIRGVSQAAILLTLGNELGTETKGIVPGDAYNDRAQWVSVNGLTAAQQHEVNEFLTRLKVAVSKSWKGPITYVKHPAENIDWDRLDVDVISLNQYYSTKWQNEEQYLDDIRYYTSRRPRLPVFITEFGYSTFQEALYWGGHGWWYILNNPDKVVYDENAQSEALSVNLRLLNSTSVNGIFLWTFMETKQDPDLDAARSGGVIRYSSRGLWSRKRSFYTYKSYQRSP
jgi:hypothetical protein